MQGLDKGARSRGLEEKFMRFSADRERSLSQQIQPPASDAQKIISGGVHVVHNIARRIERRNKSADKIVVYT